MVRGALLLLCGVMIGSCQGDRLTYHDCATVGRAKMASNKKYIKCEPDTGNDRSLTTNEKE